MFRVTRYPMISKTESGRVGYQNKYRVAGRVRVPAGHCPRAGGTEVLRLRNFEKTYNFIMFMFLYCLYFQIIYICYSV